jgi:hypothetical protein
MFAVAVGWVGFVVVLFFDLCEFNSSKISAVSHAAQLWLRQWLFLWVCSNQYICLEGAMLATRKARMHALSDPSNPRQVVLYRAPDSELSGPDRCPAGCLVCDADPIERTSPRSRPRGDSSQAPVNCCVFVLFVLCSKRTWEFPGSTM